MLFVLVCLGLMIFGSCESPVNPTKGSTVEFMFMREVESAGDTSIPTIVEGSTGGLSALQNWHRTGPNEWIGEKYLDYSHGSEYYVFDLDNNEGKGKIFFARDKDKGQDWVELTDQVQNPYVQGTMARFRLGERGVYF